MQVEIKIVGAAGAQEAIQARIAALKAKANAAVQGAGIDTEADAKQACPVDFGRLRSSIKYVPTGPSSCQVGTPVSYAPFVEHGTYASRDEPFVGHPKGMPPRPFLFPAYAKNKQKFLAELKAIKV